jgi:hypothetical protein
MLEFIENLKQLNWWLSVVFVGVLINLISPVISKKIGTRYDKWAKTRALNRDKKKQTEDSLIWIISKSLSQQSFFQARIQHERNSSSQYFLSSILAYGLGVSLSRAENPMILTEVLSIFLHLLGSITLFISTSRWTKARSMMVLLTKAMTIGPSESLEKAKELTFELEEVKELLKGQDIDTEKLDMMSARIEAIEAKLPKIDEGL